MKKLLAFIIKNVAVMLIGCAILLFGIVDIPLESIHNIANMRMYEQIEIERIEFEAYSRGYREGVSSALSQSNSSSYDYQPPASSSYESDYSSYSPEVIYTRTGECYHISYDCPALSRSKDLYTAPLSEVQNRLRPCSKCAYATDWD